MKAKAKVKKSLFKQEFLKSNIYVILNFIEIIPFLILVMKQDNTGSNFYILIALSKINRSNYSNPSGLRPPLKRGGETSSLFGKVEEFWFKLFVVLILYFI